MVYLEIDAGRRRRRSDLPGRDLLALLLQRLHHVLRVQAARLELVRVEPHAHRILAGAENIDVADAGQARQLVPDVDRGVIGEIEAIVAVVGRGQSGDQKDRRLLLLDGDALSLDGVWKLGERARHPVLHQDLRGIEIGADIERDRQRIAAVARARRLHVDHVLDAVDLLLDRQRNGIHQDAGAGAWICGRHLHGRRHDVRDIARPAKP